MSVIDLRPERISSESAILSNEVAIELRLFNFLHFLKKLFCSCLHCNFVFKSEILL